MARVTQFSSLARSESGRSNRAFRAQFAPGQKPQGRRLRLWRLPLDIFACLVVAATAFVVVSALLVPPAQTVQVGQASQSIQASFSLCTGRSSGNCVVDGDTIRVAGVKIRIADIDTPEVFSPQCAAEKRLGDRATVRMIELLNAGPIEVGSYPRDADKYGRKLRVIRRDGHSLGEVLVAEGLARRWDGARHSWCANS